VLLAVGLILQTACGPPCPAGYYRVLALPATANASPCTLSISGTANTFQYNIPSSTPGSSTGCAAFGAAPQLTCSRDPPAGDASEGLTVSVAPVDVAGFEQLVGGADFTLSLTCAAESILDRDAQSMGTICEE
jgi:hypothetical protein